MTKIQFRKAFPAFWLLVLIDLVAISFNFSWLDSISKPLLMPALLIILVYAGIASTGRKLIATGLFFSWLGDVFLLFESGEALFFIAGLVSFLITHICYIIYFLSARSSAHSLLKKQPVYILLILLYGTGLVWLLFPYLGGLKVPVILYAAVICSMLLCSIHIYTKVKGPANRYFVSGAVLFVLSDSILAINKFYQPLPLAGTWLMLSYCAAQYFIVRGELEGEGNMGYRK
ncbi:MAG: lysoplasmalogenase [Ferruginibacter sp.]